MMRSKHALFGLAVASVALLGACGSTPQVSFNHVEKRATLTNGLKLVVMPDPTTPLVQVDVRYQVGAKEDPEGKAGLAHLVEHMMFQHRFGAPETPIEQRPPTFQMLPHIATGFNAFTNWDTTHYYLVAPKEDLETLLQLEAARMATGCKTIPEAEFEREREVVRNEIRQRLGTPDGQVLYQILRTLYPENHAYHEMVGGNDAQLASIEFDDVCKFMKDYYAPQNATVIVTGNVDYEEVGRLVQAKFGGIPRGETAPAREVDEVELQYAKHVIEADVERDSIHLAFALPPRSSDKYQAAQQMLFVAALNMAQFAEEWDFGRFAGFGPLGGNYMPIAVMSIELHEGTSPDEALDYAWKAVNIARRNTGILLEGGTWASEKAAKRRYKQSVIESLEPLAGRAQLIAEMLQFEPEYKENFDSDKTLLFEYLDEVGEIDPSQYEDFVKKTLDKDKAVVVVVNANEEGLSGDKRASLKFSAKTHEERPAPPVDLSEINRELKAPQSDSILKEAERYTLGNGMRVVLLPYETLPIVHANLVFDVGAVHEPTSKAGLADVAASFLRLPMGATAFTETGVSVRGAATDDHTTFTSRGMSIYLKEVLAAPERLIVAGEISQEAIEDYRDNFKRTFERESYLRNYTYRMQVAAALYGANHPYVTNGAPTPKTLAKIGRDAAFDFIRSKYKAKNATLFVVGNFDPQAAKNEIEDLYGGWDGGSKAEPVTSQAAKRTGPEYIGVVGREGQPQMQVTIAYPAPAGIDDQEAPRRVLAEMLNQRMATIRTELGSTYGAYAGRRARIGPGAYQMGGSIDAARAGESLVYMREQIDALRAGEGFDRDFVVARRIILKKLLAESTESYTLAARLRQIAGFGLDPDYYDKLIRNVAKTTPDQVKSLMAKELDPSMEIVVAMADRPTLEKAFGEAGLDQKGSRIVEPSTSGGL